jgi:hypothetical protein
MIPSQHRGHVPIGCSTSAPKNASCGFDQRVSVKLGWPKIGLRREILNFSTVTKDVTPRNRLPPEQKVRGSNPLGRTKISNLQARPETRAPKGDQKLRIARRSRLVLA